MDVFVLILELIGTASFAVSGAVLGLRKSMDIFGVIILGLTTAVGGGVLRDVILGVHPPVMFQDPVYALCAIGVSILIFLPCSRRVILKNRKLYDALMLITDSAGLGVFTVIGVKIALEIAGKNLFLAVFVGTVTGVGGGVLRDLLARETPYIFVRHIYACAAIAGALACYLLWQPLGDWWAMLCGLVLIFLIRLCSAHFKWNLPRASKTDCL